MKPKFDHLVKRPNGRWVSSTETDITVRWEKARKQLEADADERKRIVAQLPRIGKAAGK